MVRGKIIAELGEKSIKRENFLVIGVQKGNVAMETEGEQGFGEKSNTSKKMSY